MTSGLDSDPRVVIYDAIGTKHMMAMLEACLSLSFSW